MDSGAAFAPQWRGFLGAPGNLPVQRQRGRRFLGVSVVGLGGGRGERRASMKRFPGAVCLSEIAGEGGKKGGPGGGFGTLPNSNYVVPLDKAAMGIIRPLGEILRDLNKKVTENIVSKSDRSIPWYHVNRLLSFYAPGWCGEIRNVIYSNDATVTVVYRVTVRGIDGEAHRESTGTASLADGAEGDAVARAEQIAFCRACARFGLGLYLYHEKGNL